MATKKKPVKPLKKSAENTKLDFLELENRIECMERDVQRIEKALAEGLENINTCMEHILKMIPKVKKTAERLGIES